ncbi:SRPBCC domain-containing protein [Microbacterium sp. CFH 90308]|uniref:SRPBCC domain-containing protein n=1 Tax=Microbacterium salsuginis TaxID=2722803 RepID=A0ABX1KF02_9MICO|nr:SRPBCC domain-containing protein [Microbacterium sp. CFH 90308]NLP84940.1 SRPBCC domain-containing protein [Microbacterium sp. CFH 90308]
MTDLPPESDRIDGATLTMVRVFDAPREQVFDAWTNPDTVTRWWGPAGLHTPRDTVRIVAEVGGEWTATMIDEDGTEFRSHSIFTVLDRPNRIELTAAPGSEMPSTLSITLTEVEGMTIMTVVNRVLTEEPGLDSMAEGWASILEKLRGALGERVR